MADLQIQGISVGGDNNPTSENIRDEVPQLVNARNWKPEGIIFPMLSNNLQNTYEAFKKISLGGNEYDKVRAIFILFPVDYIK